jgi:hypothetical protein
MEVRLSRQVSEKSTRISSFLKIRRMGEELFDQNGLDLTKLIGAPRNFAIAPKNMISREKHLTLQG